MVYCYLSIGLDEKKKASNSCLFTSDIVIIMDFISSRKSFYSSDALKSYQCNHPDISYQGLAAAFATLRT